MQRPRSRSEEPRLPRGQGRGAVWGRGAAAVRGWAAGDQGWASEGLEAPTAACSPLGGVWPARKPVLFSHPSRLPVAHRR